MKSIALPLAIVLCLALLGAGAWFVLASAPARPVGGAQPLPAGAAAVRPAPVESAPELRSVGALPERPDAETATTVAWPVDVELELLEAADNLRAEGLPALGSGRTARMRGRVTLNEPIGAQASLTFEAGLNAGRVIHTNADGYFGVNDLYPGISLVRVSGPAIQGSLREVRLLRDKETILSLGYGLPGSVAGKVFDEAQQPMPGVAVELDGRPGVTDEQGVFRFTGIPGGFDAVLILRAPGYATQYHLMGIAAGRDVPVGKYQYRMERGGSLVVELPKRAGVAGPAEVLLSTGMPEVKSVFAWHLLGPYAVMPGSSVQIDDLPPMRIQVRVQHRGALARPPMAVALVRPNHVERVSFELEKAPSLRGRVTDAQGLAAQSAIVRLEAPDRAAATLGHLAMMPATFELQFYPSLAVAEQETRSDHDGNFTFTAAAGPASSAYLLAISADGKQRGWRAVKLGDAQVDLRMAPITAGRARLELDFEGRRQGLPVRVTVNGELRPEVILAVDQPLELDGLAPGRWRMKARWNGEPLLGGSGHEDFDLEGDLRRSLPLPTGAIEGQDLDTLERARG